MTALDTRSSLRLAPALSPALRAVIDDHELLVALVRGFGAPLNVVLPTQLGANVAAVRRAFERHAGLRYRVFVAHKPNRSASIVRQAATEAVGLDVASEGELRSALVNGFTGERMVATGPKNRDFLRLAVQHGVQVNVDNAAELDQVEGTRRALGLPGPVPVAVRVSGLVRDGQRLGEHDSKFGVPVDDVPALVRSLAERRDSLRFMGFAVHFTSPSARQRAAAAEVLIDLHVEAMRRGLAPRSLNLGGGFRVRHLDDPDAWDAYVSGLKAGLLGQGPSLSWGGYGFGMRADGGTIVGAAQLPSFAHSEPVDAELAAVLDEALPRHGGRALGTVLAENGIELHLEPGRVMYDQLGLTVTRVNFTKRTPGGEWLVGLDLNRSNLDDTREFFVDPVVVPQSPVDVAEQPAGAVGVYFGGNLCTPADVVLRHKTFLDRLPAAGDLVVFPNTAAYFMDFTQSETLLQRVAAKVAVAPGPNGSAWWRDDDYDPLPTGLRS